MRAAVEVEHSGCGAGECVRMDGSSLAGEDVGIETPSNDPAAKVTRSPGSINDRREKWTR
jgi:hypothetical protein